MTLAVSESNTPIASESVCCEVAPWVTPLVPCTPLVSARTLSYRTNHQTTSILSLQTVPYTVRPYLTITISLDVNYSVIPVIIHRNLLMLPAVVILLVIVSKLMIAWSHFTNEIAYPPARNLHECLGNQTMLVGLSDYTVLSLQALILHCICVNPA